MGGSDLKLSDHSMRRSKAQSSSILHLLQRSVPIVEPSQSIRARFGQPFDFLVDGKKTPSDMERIEAEQNRRASVLMTIKLDR